MELTLNGERVVAEPREGQSLLELLRRPRPALGQGRVRPGGLLRGCTVLVDGKAVVSCAQKATRVEGKDVVTHEGLGEDVREAWAKSFVAAGASQCGFCSPGIVMKAEVFWERTRADAGGDLPGAARQPLPLHGLREGRRRDRAQRAGSVRRAAAGAGPHRPSRLPRGALRRRRARARRQAVRGRPRRPGDAVRGASLLGPSAPASCASTRRGPRPIPASSPC